MLTKKQIGILFVVTLLPFLVYLSRPELTAADGYYFLQGVCKSEYEIKTLPLHYIALSVLPCNIIAIKLFLFALCFLSVVIIACMGTLINEKQGWKAGLLAFLSPLLVFEFAKFENDQFAFPLLFLSAYFLLKSFQSDTRKKQLLNQGIAGTLILIACGFWAGGLYYVIVFGLTTLLFFAGSIALLALYGKRLFIELVGLGGVDETLQGVSLFYLFGLILGYLNIPKNIFVPLVFLTFISLVNFKFTILAVPFACLATLQFFLSLPQRYQNILLYLSVFLAIGWGMNLLIQPPFPHHWEAVNYAVEQADGNVIQNDWSYGYWIEHAGGIPSSRSSPLQQGRHGYGVVLTQKPLNEDFFRNYKSCKHLKQFQDINVFKCNE